MANRRVFLAMALAFGMAVQPSQSQGASFQGLGHLPGGEFYSYAHGISADGSVVVGSGRGQFGAAEAFRWTDQTGMVGLGFLTDVYRSSLSLGVSADGAVVVGDGSNERIFTEAFRWTSESGMQGLGSLGMDNSSGAKAASADGSVIVGYSEDEAFRWTEAEGMVGLGYLPGHSVSSAMDVSADGNVVVGQSRVGFGGSAFRWTEDEGMTDIGTLGDGAAMAFAVSADGSVIVGFSGSDAFRWTLEEGMIGLGRLPELLCAAYDVSDDGRVVVGTCASPERQSRAFVWDAELGIHDLGNVLVGQGINMNGWRLHGARGVSADGRTIVGNGINPSGQTEAYIATIDAVPEPASLWLAASAGIGAIVMHRSSKWRQRFLAKSDSP